MIDSIPQPIERALLKMNLNDAIKFANSALLSISPTVHQHVSKRMLYGSYRGQMIDIIHDQIYKLENGDIDQIEFIHTIRDSVLNSLKTGDFDEWLDEKQTLAGSRLYTWNKEWFLKVYKIKDGEQDLPHHHNNLTSFQVIVEGNLRLKEYDRLERVNEDTIRIKQVNDSTLGPGESFITTEHSQNVHWFAPVEGDVTSINFSIRGYWDDLFDENLVKLGRHYLIPQDETEENGTMLAREVSKEEAIEKLELKD